jgi:hypothetical protein
VIWNVLCRKCTRQASFDVLSIDSARQAAIAIGWKFDGKSLICKKCAGKNYDPNPVKVKVDKSLVSSPVSLVKGVAK